MITIWQFGNLRMEKIGCMGWLSKELLLELLDCNDTQYIPEPSTDIPEPYTDKWCCFIFKF